MSTSQNALTDGDTPAAREDQRDPTWPVVVGVVAIVVMGMNLLRLVIELTFQGMTILRMKDTRFWQLPVALQFGRHIWDLGFVVTLVLAALSLIRRRHTARFNLMIWSVLYIIYVVVSSGERIGLCFNPTTGAVSGSFLFRTLAYKLMDLALPVFLLIWFCRQKIKDQIRGWAEQSTGAQPVSGRAQSERTVPAASAKRADKFLDERKASGPYQPRAQSERTVPAASAKRADKFLGATGQQCPSSCAMT